MNGYVFTDQPTANAFAAAVETALGYPKNGTRIGSGIHGPTYRARSVRYSEVRKHATLSQWYYPSDATVNGSGVSVPPAGATEQAITQSDWNVIATTTYVGVVLIMGDSIAEGLVGSVSGDGWRPAFWRAAKAANFPITLVGSITNGPLLVDGLAWARDHDGHQGYAISGLSAIAAARVTTYKPDVVLLMIGTNDANGNVDLPGAQARLVTLLNAIYGAKSDVIVAMSTILPMGNGSANVVSINTAVTGAIAAQASNRAIRLVNAYSTFSANANYAADWMADNLHPNDAGYAVLAQIWFTALQSLERAA